MCSQNEMMLNKKYKKLDEGTFTKDDMDYSYVIEQDNTQTLPNNVRVRITKVKPKIKAVRTRYEPHIEVEGERNAYVPAYFGYDPKRLRDWKYLVIMVFLGIWLTFLLMFNIDLTKNLAQTIPTISFSPWLATTVNIGLKLFFTIFFIFTLLIPSIIRNIQGFRMYFKLKKVGLDFDQINK